MKALFLLAAAAIVGSPGALYAQGDLQQEIRDSQRRLEEVRAERARLRQEMGNRQNQARDVSAELRNIEQQLSASRSTLAEIEFQSDAMGEMIEGTTSTLLQTRERLSQAEAVLQRRLRDIYKRGPLHTVQVLLGADSFSDLLTRYRYLQMIATYDRTIVERVGMLEGQLVERGDRLTEDMRDLGRIRANRLGEVAQLRAVEGDHQNTLSQFRSAEEQNTSQLEVLDSDEMRLTALIADLETRRREAEARRDERAGPGTLSAGDEGSLDWPLDGDIIYGFGPQRQPNGTILRWNGIGIRASAGTPVRAVRAGNVALAGPLEGYGRSVMISHGDGFYTLYLYLEDIGVVQGRDVEAGQVIGTVGGTETPEGSHVEFQVRAPIAGGSPEAQDPILWLKARGG